MKKIISVLCVLALLITFFSSCKVKGPSGDEEGYQVSVKENADCETGSDSVAKNFEIEELYYYQSLFDLLEENQSSEDMGAFNYYKDFHNVILYNKTNEPQAISHVSGKCSVFADQSLGLPFAELSTQFNANPFSNFNLLVDKGWVVPEELYKPDPEGVVFDFTHEILSDFGLYMEYNVPMFSVEKSYAYSEQGCKDFLRTVCALENLNPGTQKIVALPDQREMSVGYSPDDDCYFSFIINYNTSYAFITALYFRSSDGKYIDNVTTQLMYIAFPCGDGSAGVSLSFVGIDAKQDLGKMSFFMSLERALTGDCLLSEDHIISYEDHNKKYVIPYEYEGDNYSAKISEKFYKTALDYPDKKEDSTDFYIVYTYSLKLK